MAGDSIHFFNELCSHGIRRDSCIKMAFDKHCYRNVSVTSLLLFLSIQFCFDSAFHWSNCNSNRISTNSNPSLFWSSTKQYCHYSLYCWAFFLWVQVPHYLGSKP